MRKLILTSLLMSIFLAFCDGYQQSAVSAEYLSSLNASINEGQKTNATWINSPEEITRHLFPPVSHGGRPKFYNVEKKIKSATDCTVIITEEVAIDDEVLGERRTLQFQALDGHWSINDIKYEIKRLK
jgi:hypothetical protein